MKWAAITFLLCSVPVAAAAGDAKDFLRAPSDSVMLLRPSCVIMPALKLCPGDPPTVWLDPKAQPRDVARRLLEALVQMGFREQ